ncbi:UDP-N-acetylglucosamine 2-epimerase [Thalassospiraceae bacterium LMO-JJ14]|nr:UDP-N-acetylglucosamine 2-epimerase [Thalassospiraceae bacterium LMO-JJ14]
MDRYPIGNDELAGPFVTFMTATRADFGKLKPLIERVEASGKFHTEIVATGMHLLKKYGFTVNAIHKAGFSNIFPLFNQSSNTMTSMDLSLASALTQFSHYINERNPDLFVVHGDRIEALAGALSGSLNNVRIAHIEGGEVSGTIDESMRHAISKLVHVHFVSNDSAKDRLLQLGEREDSIFVIGSPEVDVLRSNNLPTLDEAKEYYEIDFDEYAIFICHPVTTEINLQEKKIKAIIKALAQTGHNYIVVHSNNDLGSDNIMTEVNHFAEQPNVKLFPSLRFEEYLTLLKNARYIVGNSSSGVREAPVFGVPCVNIGTRQKNRAENHAIFDTPEDTDAIYTTIMNLPSRVEPCMSFGEGGSADKFFEILRGEEIWQLPLQKSFIDRPVR